MKQDKYSAVRVVAIVCAFLFTLSGCIEDKENYLTAPALEDSSNAVEMVLSGSVGDGPIVNGRIVLRAADGSLLAVDSSGEFARYELTVGLTDDDLPLIIRAEDGVDLVTGALPDFPLLAGISSLSEGQVANLNPMGTLTLKVAQQMDGGLTAENLSAANKIIGKAMNFGLDTALFPDATSTDVNDENVANVIRSSESLGESIRRTRDALISNGVTDAEQVMDALSADLIDGMLDGRGAPGADPRITAVNNVVSAQVVLETMANQLKVGGVDATSRLDNAIRHVTPDNPSVALTDSIRVNEPFLKQASVLLDAAIQTDSNADLVALRQAIDGIQPGQSQQELPAQLKNGLSDALAPTIQQLSVASLDEINLVNEAVRQGFESPVPETNGAPTIDGSPATSLNVNSAYSFQPVASDPDDDSLTFSISGKPSWAKFESATGHLSGTPATTGDYPGIRISVSDGIETASLPAFTISVNALPNRTPTISGLPVDFVHAGSSYTFQPEASDPDGDALTFWISGKPSWAKFDSATGRLSGAPGVGDVGSYSGVRISVSDDLGASAALSAFTLTVALDAPPNQPPTISGSPTAQVETGSSYSFQPTASDPDGDALTFRISGKPSWASFNSTTGRLSGTAGAAGSYPNIWITVSDSKGGSTTLPSFTITVNERPNRTPTISGSPAAQVEVGSLYKFVPTASDPDQDQLKFSISGKPVWASFNVNTGQLSGTPDASRVGTYSGIRISVSDGEAIVSLPAFSITVNALPNRAPTISGSPSTQVSVGSAYSFKPSASDPDQDTLKFSISGKPAWASFNVNTGLLSGTPNTADSHSGIRISVSDGNATASLPSFAITVNGVPNRAPTISGSPASEVMVDTHYAFTPTASDPDGDDLKFSISGKPAWASFNVNTGHLSGTPDASRVGTYSGIRISVFDGTDTVSLGSFSIEVVAQALGNASLTWTAPTLNEDGSTLTDLAGFKVYYGTTTDSMDTIKTINNSSVTTYLVENLHAGTWHFKVTAFDTTGNESVDSEIGSKLVQP